MDSTIESIQNPRIKHAARLRDARARRKHDEFLIDGALEIARACAAGIQLKTVFYSDPKQFEGQSIDCNCLQLVSEPVLEKLSYGNHQAPVAVAATPALPLSRMKLTSASLVLVLDQTEKPGNLGACIRTASACGVDAIVLTDPVCEVFNPNAIRASRGAVFSMPIAHSGRDELLEVAKRLGLRVLSARVDGRASLWNCNFTGGAVIVFGSEAHGLGADWDEAVETSFQIPMKNRVDSLNVSISVAVTLYEAIRQRGNSLFDEPHFDV